MSLQRIASCCKVFAHSILVLCCVNVLMTSSAKGDEMKPLQVPPTLSEEPYDGFTVVDSDEAVLNLKKHKLSFGGRQADGRYRGPFSRCDWMMPTPWPGYYVVTLNVNDGKERFGRFGYVADGEHVSDEFRGRKQWQGDIRSFRICVPPGQPVTRMFIRSKMVYLNHVDIARVTKEVDFENADGKMKELEKSSYRTVLKRARKDKKAPSCVVLVPRGLPEAGPAKMLASSLGLPVREEPEIEEGLPEYPPVKNATSDTSLILLNGGMGGPLVRAFRRAELIQANHAIPGRGGYCIRTVPHPFIGKANVIVISACDLSGLEAGVNAFKPKVDPATNELIYDTFLTDNPGSRWKSVRNYRYRLKPGDSWWDKYDKRLKQPFGGSGAAAPARQFIHHTGGWGDWYWRTGNDKFAQLFKGYIFKMEKEDIFGNRGNGKDSHMALYQLIRGWERCEESPVFSDKDRLRITNYLLLRCIEGNEGFKLAWNGYGTYSGKVLMRHNHQTILGCGMMQAYIYFRKHYRLPRAKMWKEWCDDLIANGTRWGHAPEDSANYEIITFNEVVDMIHWQGLSTKGVKGTEKWPEVAMRQAGIRDSFSLSGVYGDCWDYAHSSALRFMEVMGQEWDWPAAQFMVDRTIEGYRIANPKSYLTSGEYPYLHGSTAVGGVKPPPDPRKTFKELNPLLGLAALPMTEGYYSYLSGKVGNNRFWEGNPRPKVPPYRRTADKIQYRSGWGVNDEYLLLETLGWANHAHMDLGTIVQYCHGGRLWIVDAGYENTGPENHSTLEVSRNGKAAWGFYGKSQRWGDFRAGPQMFEIVKLDPRKPGKPGPFTVVCRAFDLAGATWVRTISGGKGRGLLVEDVLTAEKPGDYKAAFRLRLLGKVEGEAGNWIVRQKGAALPVQLQLIEGDQAAIGKWIPEGHGFTAGKYPWYAFNVDDGKPKMLEWTRKIHLEAGMNTRFRAVIGPSVRE